MQFVNLKNKRFGKLVALYFYDRHGPRGRIRWWVRCDCGIEKAVRADALGTTLTCGCAKITHGLYNTRTYQSWKAARYRCENPKACNYEYYGGRGITFHAPWRYFTVFLKDVGKSPTEDHTIDRIDVDGNYEPGNVRWATRSEQDMNKRKRKVEIPVSEDDYEWVF